MKIAGGFGSRCMTGLINNIVKEGCIHYDWRKSILVPVYTGKGDPLVCGSYRAIKLLEQPVKVRERVLVKMIRCQVSIACSLATCMEREPLMPFHHVTSTRETPNKEEKAVLCFCGSREGI